MAEVIATANKSSPESPMGISMGTDKSSGKLVLKRIDKAGLFGNSGLRVGQVILEINGVNVTNFSTTEAVQFVKSKKGEITIHARDPIMGEQQQQRAQPPPASAPTAGPAATTSLNLNDDAIDYLKKYYFHGKDIEMPLSPPPLLFSSRNIPSHKWNHIFAMFKNELVPAVTASVSTDYKTRHQMASHHGETLMDSGMGTHRSAQKVLEMRSQNSIQSTNLALVGCNIIVKCNAMLNPHGVMAELTFMEKPLQLFFKGQKEPLKEKIPIGIKFTSI